MKKGIHTFAGFILLLIVALGCGNLGKVTEIVDKAAKPNTVTSTDGKVQLTIPASWKSGQNLNPQAVLQVAEPLNELYTIVIPDPKKDFDKTADLEFVTDLVRKNTESTLENSSFGETKLLEVNGYPARQFEATGVIEKIKAKYIFTLVDTPDTFYQIMSWTLESKYSENKSKLMNVVNTFNLKDEETSSAPQPKSDDAKRNH